MQFDITDTDAIKTFLKGYSVDMFRELPAILDTKNAALAMAVSEMTILRLIECCELQTIHPESSKIAKTDLVSFIFKHFFSEFPIEISDKNPDISQIIPKNPH